MTSHDIDRATADLALYRRAGALCAVAEPHRDADEDWPCTRHLLQAATQLAIPAAHVAAPAIVPSTGGSAAAGGGAFGAAVRGASPAELVSPAASPSKKAVRS